MQFANIITGEIRSVLSPTLVKDGATIQGATLADWSLLGWRRVVNVAEPTDGYRVTSYNVVETGLLTCDLTVKTEVSLADEAAALVAAQKAEARALLESTEGLGRLLMTLAEQLVILINVERAQHSRAAITSAQIKTTLQNALL